MFEINPDVSVKIEKVGQEQSIVLVMDNFFLDYELARQEAIQANYSSDKQVTGAFYPGVRAPLRKDYGIKILQFAARAIFQNVDLANKTQVQPINANYSLITKQPQDMELLQCIPHFDTSEDLHFAALHYMNSGDFGGTAFYQHLPTGFENITTERESAYLASMQKVFDDKGPPLRQYFSDSDHHYQLIHRVDYKPNRVVVYPTTLLHTAYINDAKKNVNNDPSVGRLSSNFLFKFV